MRPRHAIPMLLAIAMTIGAGACSPGGGSVLNDAWLDMDVPADTSTDGSDPAGCTSSIPYCSTNHLDVLQCNPLTGAVTVVETCTGGQACVDGACATTTCFPGTFQCVDDQHSQLCDADGSGWTAIDCVGTDVCNETSGQCGPPCKLRIFILQDQSGSMGDGTPAKWDQARTALDAVMTSPAAADIEFGFGAFPTDGSCGTGSAVVIHPVPSASAAIVDDYFVDNGPNGATPLSDAMEFFLTDFTANLNDPEYNNALLLVSDGMDTCYVDCVAMCGFDMACLLSCETDSEALVAAKLTSTTVQLRDTHQIRSFVIGFGADVSDAQLSAVAENGGTVLGDWIQASNVDELTAALQTVIDEMLECNPIMI